jgi:hypothetical protein
MLNPFMFFLALLPIGLLTGWAIGAGLSFTGGSRRVDLVAGLAGAILAALPLHLLGPPGYRETLPALIIGVSAAMFATWLLLLSGGKLSVPDGSALTRRRHAEPTGVGD